MSQQSKKSSKTKLCIFFFIINCFINGVFAQKTASANWMRQVKFGIMVHYLSFLQNGTEPLDMGKITNWDSCVNAFDVNLFAKQMHQINAGYVIFTSYQGTRFMCAPNKYYEKMTGYARGQATSHRDLIKDLANALQRYKIKFILYVTTDGNWKDNQSNQVFKSPMLKLQQNGNNFIADKVWVDNWTPVLKEWSERYKNKIAGWWVDGSYRNHGFNDTLLAKFYYALKTGNSNSILCFNNAVHPKIEFYTRWESYTAGEMNEFRDLPPAGGRIQGKQWHILSFLGTDWFSPAIKYTSSYLIDYLNQVNSLGGVATIDVAVYRNGSIAPEQLIFLQQISKGVKPR